MNLHCTLRGLFFALSQERLAWEKSGVAKDVSYPCNVQKLQAERTVCNADGQSVFKLRVTCNARLHCLMLVQQNMQIFCPQKGGTPLPDWETIEHV